MLSREAILNYLNNDDLQEKRLSRLRNWGFDIVDGSLYQQDNPEDDPVKLSEVVVYPLCEIVRDSGDRQDRIVQVVAVRSDGTMLPSKPLSAKEYERGNWLTEYVGPRALYPYARKKCLEAVRILGIDIPEVWQYTNVGWVEKDGRRVFLHAGGAIGDDSTVLDPSESRTCLQRYRLPPECPDVQEAGRIALATLGAANERVTYPLLATVALAPLCELFWQVESPMDFSLFLLDQTESKEDSLAALFLAFFGNFGHDNFPADLKQKADQIKKNSFLLKDVLMVLDTRNCGPSATDRRNAADILTYLANASDREYYRLKSVSTSSKTEWYTRGMTLCVGDSRPSLSPVDEEKYVFLSVGQADINQDALRNLNVDKGLLAELMREYISWIGDNWDGIREDLSVLLAEARAQVGRTSFAKLLVGFETFLCFMREREIIVDIERDQMITRMADICHRLESEEVDVSRCICDKFFSAIRELIAKGQVVLLGPEDLASEDMTCIGCYDDYDYYLLFGKTYLVVREYYCQVGQPFEVAIQGLIEHLKNTGQIHLFPGGEHIKQSRLRTFGGAQKNIMRIPKNKADLLSR